MHTSRPATLLLLALSGAASLATSSNSISTVEDSGPSWVASGSTTTTTGLLEADTAWEGTLTLQAELPGGDDGTGELAVMSDVADEQDVACRYRLTVLDAAGVELGAWERTDVRGLSSVQIDALDALQGNLDVRYHLVVEMLEGDADILLDFAATLRGPSGEEGATMVAVAMTVSEGWEESELGDTADTGEEPDTGEGADSGDTGDDTAG